jgi:hypothetical protein
MTCWSTIVTRRIGQPRLSFIWALGAIAALCSLGTTPLTHAAGCHSQDRPVISGTLAWETDQVFERAPKLARAPSLLTHPRCGEEIPLGSGSSTLPALPAALNAAISVPIDSRESLFVDTRREHSEPPGTRLDRPPR